MFNDNFERHTTQIIIIKILILISGINIVANSFHCALRPKCTRAHIQFAVRNEWQKRERSQSETHTHTWESFIRLCCHSLPHSFTQVCVFPVFTFHFAIRSIIIMKDPLNKLQLNVICVSFHFVFNNNTVSLLFILVCLLFFHCSIDKIKFSSANVNVAFCLYHFLCERVSAFVRRAYCARIRCK